MIDELILVLGLNPSQFTAGQKVALEAMRKLEEQAVKSGKETESQSKKLLDFFSNLKREAIGFLGAFYGGRGIKDVIGHIVQLDSSAARLSKTFNTSPHDLALWRVAMREVGASAEDADAAIGGLSQAVQDFLLNPANADPNLLAVFNRIGIKPGEVTDPLAVLKKLAEFSQTPEMRGHPERFAAVARLLPGMNQPMINLLMELNKRLTAAEKVTPEGGGAGAFSEEFIASITLFDTAATNIARVLLDFFVPAINKFTELLQKWLILPGTPEAKALDTKFEKDIQQHFGTPPAWLSRLFGQEPQGPPPKLVPRGDTGIGSLADATGWSVEEGGVIIAGGTFPATGARSAASARSVHNRWHHQASQTHSTHIGAIHVNAPNAKDAHGIASGIRGALDHSLGAPVNSAY